jgi:hypothetical protein
LHATNRLWEMCCNKCSYQINKKLRDSYLISDFWQGLTLRGCEKGNCPSIGLL